MPHQYRMVTGIATPIADPTGDCWSITSLTRMAYGSRVFRQGSRRPCWLYQANTSSCIVLAVVAAMGARYRSESPSP